MSSPYDYEGDSIYQILNESSGETDKNYFDVIFKKIVDKCRKSIT